MAPSDSPLQSQVEPLIEESVEVAATPEALWALVADPLLMPRWSPQVWRVAHLSGTAGGAGSRYRNLNRSGLLVWATRSEVVECEPMRRFAWRIPDNRVVWSFELAPGSPGKVLVIHRRECPQGVAHRALRLERLFMGGVPRFQASLRTGMRQTLTRIAAAAEV